MLVFDTIQIAYMYMPAFQKLNAGQGMDDMLQKHLFFMIGTLVNFELLDSLNATLSILV